MKLASNITQTYTSVHPTGDGFHLRLLTTAVGIATQERIIMRPPDPRFSNYGNVRIFANMVQVKYPAKHPAHLVGIKRGVVGLEFSGKKRKRMIDKFNQWRMPMRNMVFVHLTYPAEYDQDWHTWKLHLKTFKYHLQRRFPNAQGMWKLELQRRGAPHYHMVIDLGQNCSIRRFRQWLDGVWARIAHDLDQYGGRYACRAEIVTSKRHALNYAAKYCGKVTYAPVDENGEEITSCGMRDTIGRQWGILGKPDFSPSQEWRVLREQSTYFRLQAALEIKGRGAHGWRSMSKRTWQGSFSVYGIGDDTEYTTRQANVLIPSWEKRYYDSDDPWREIWEIEQRLWGGV